MNWKFCPECGGKFEAAWKFCANCGAKREGAVNQGLADFADLMRQMREQEGKQPPVDLPWNQPWVIPMAAPLRRCAYEGLPPGVYHMYCDCPKCTPQLTTTTTYGHLASYTSVPNS